jgi:hypothetical protein
MTYPDFFDLAPRIRVRDPLAVYLGASEDGIFEYSYLDAVKLAGHSCPTVAGTFLMVRAGLRALFGDALPERGAIRTFFPDAASCGVTGVMANVASLITGGRESDGFHGIGGQFNRNGLLGFEADMSGTMGLESCADGKCVVVDYQPRIVPPAPEMRPLLQLCLGGLADDGQRREFGRLWQDRVRRLLVEHADDPEMIRVRAENAR